MLGFWLFRPLRIESKRTTRAALEPKLDLFPSLAFPSSFSLYLTIVVSESSVLIAHSAPTFIRVLESESSSSKSEETSA